MSEPTETKHRDLVDQAVEALANMTPSAALPSNNQLGEALCRSISHNNTRHQVVRLIGSRYAIDGTSVQPPRGGATSVEEELARDIRKTAEQLGDLRSDRVPVVLGRMADDYLAGYLDDQAALSRWLLFCAIATVPGELAPEDEIDRNQFRESTSAWLDEHLTRYASSYQVLLDALGRSDRCGDGLATMSRAIGMLAEGAILRSSIDGGLSRDDALNTFRRAVLALVATFTAVEGDERHVDDVIAEALTPRSETG